MISYFLSTHKLQYQKYIIYIIINLTVDAPLNLAWNNLEWCLVKCKYTLLNISERTLICKNENLLDLMV